MTRYLVSHRTEYNYDIPVTSSQMIAHMRPRDTERQRVITDALIADPMPEHVVESYDSLGNRRTYLALESPHSSLAVHASCEVEIAPEPVPTGATLHLPWESAAELTAREVAEPRWYRSASAMVQPNDDLFSYASGSFSPGRSLFEAASDLNNRVFGEFSFDPSFSEIGTPLDEVLLARRGVCQDFAHLMIGLFRSHGLAARYVSGYLETQPPPGFPKLVGADASHAWCAVWIPGFGWLELDPTNGIVAPTTHVVLAYGRDFNDVAPLRGVLFGPPASHEMQVLVDVIRVA